MSLLMLHIMCLSFGQLAKIISFPPSNTVGVISGFFVVKHEITIFVYDLCIQIEVNHTFTAKSRLVFDHKKFFAVKFVSNSFPIS